MKDKEPVSGEWWMVQSIETKRIAVIPRDITC